MMVAREKGFSLKDAVEHYAHLGALNQSVTVEVAIDELLSAASPSSGMCNRSPVRSEHNVTMRRTHRNGPQCFPPETFEAIKGRTGHPGAKADRSGKGSLEDFIALCAAKRPTFRPAFDQKSFKCTAIQHRG